MSAFSPRFAQENTPLPGIDAMIEGLPAALLCGSFDRLAQPGIAFLKRIGVKYVVREFRPQLSPPPSELQRMKLLRVDPCLSVGMLYDHLERMKLPRPPDERVLPLIDQLGQLELDLLTCNAHRVGCALLRGQGVFVNCDTSPDLPDTFIGAVLVLLGCEHDDVAEMIYPHTNVTEPERKAHLTAILAHIRQLSIESCHLVDQWRVGE